MDQRNFTAQLQMLHCGQIVRHVHTAHVHFQSGITHSPIGVVEKVVQNVEDGRLTLDELLKVLGMEVMAVHVHGGEENGFHLVVT